MARPLIDNGAMAKVRRTRDSGQIASADDTAASQDRIAAAEDNRQQTTENSPDRIAARAYELYLARGGGHGQDWDDWLEAERELASSVTPRSDRTE